MLKEIITEMLEDDISNSELKEIVKHIGYYKKRVKDLEDFADILHFLTGK